MKKILSLILLFSFIQQTAFSIEDIHKVYLKDAIDTALKNNIDLQAAKIDIDIAKNNITSANRIQNPAFDVFYNIGASGWSEPRQLGLSQTVEVAKRKARKNLALANLKLVEKNVGYTEFDLKMDVREAYINLVAAKSVLETLEQQRYLQEELLSIANKRFKLQEVPQIDVIQAEIALNQMITQVNTAKTNVKNALSDFNKIINDPKNITYDSRDNIFAEENNFFEMMTPSPDREFPNFNEIICKALENRYDIQIAKQEIDVAEKNLTVVTRQKVPDISVSGGYAYQLANHTEDGRFNSGGYVGASLINIPLFYNYSPEIQNAALKVQQAELKYNSIKNKAVKDISAAYDKFLTAAENLNYYESKILTSSEELIEVSKHSYESGKSDITSLIVMKQSYKSIIVGYTYALAEYYNSWTNFLREVNDENFSLL